MSKPQHFSRKVIRTTAVLMVLVSLVAPRLLASPNGQSVTFEWIGATDSASSGGAFSDSALISPPANDNFSNAQPILGRSGIILGTNVGATKEAGEPNHAGSSGGKSVWYKWQAPEDGRFVFTTFGTSFETVLAVYTGNSLPGTPVASNSEEPFSGCFLLDSGPPPSSSRVAFNAVGGTVYHIAVDVRFSSSSGGDVTLRWGASATISGRVSDVSGRPVPGSMISLTGDACRKTEFDGEILFTDVPRGHSYTIDVRNNPSISFRRWGTTASISPLSGDVSDFNFYQSTPTISINGTVTMPGGNTSGLKVMCVSNPSGVSATAPVFSQQADDLGAGKYQCPILPIGGDYVVTPSKLGFTFTLPSITLTFVTQNVFNVNFIGTAAPPRTISGRVTLPNGTTGVSGVSIALGGSQIASSATDANGNYSFTGVLQGGNYTVTPSNANFTFTPLSSTFNNLTADQTANFTATLFQLILEESGQVAALDSVLHTRDPFPIVNNSNLLNRGVDRNTRVVLFVSGFALGPGELPSSVTINLVGSNNQTYNIPAEDVRPASDPTFTQIIFRLPDDLTPGICTLAVKVHALTSNIGAMRIGP